MTPKNSGPIVEMVHRPSIDKISAVPAQDINVHVHVKMPTAAEKVAIEANADLPAVMEGATSFQNTFKGLQSAPVRYRHQLHVECISRGYEDSDEVDVMDCASFLAKPSASKVDLLQELLTLGGEAASEALKDPESFSKVYPIVRGTFVSFLNGTQWYTKPAELNLLLTESAYVEWAETETTTTIKPANVVAVMDLIIKRQGKDVLVFKHTFPM